jgi:hypothetical protein
MVLDLPAKILKILIFVLQFVNDASHLQYTCTTLGRVFPYTLLYLCELTEGSPRRNYTFTSSIQRAPSRPGTVRTRKQSESGEMCEIKQIT